MIYPKNITIESDKLKDLLVKKGQLITVGRAKSLEIEGLEEKMKEIDQKIIAEEQKVNIDDFLAEEKVITEEVNKAIEQMKAIKEKIHARLKEHVPAELYTEYEEADKLKEKLEDERNKIALKAQKMNDKIIPLGKELMKPFLEDQYEDYESLSLENNEIVATIFNHLVEWKQNFNKKQK